MAQKQEEEVELERTYNGTKTRQCNSQKRRGTREQEQRKKRKKVGKCTCHASD